MTVNFEGSDKKFLLGWNVDSDGDYFLTDRGMLHNYFVEKMTNGKVPDAEVLARAIVNRFGRDSSFAVDGIEVKNYLTNVDDLDDFYSEIGCYAIQYGKLFERLQGLLKPLNEQKELTDEELDKKIDEFLKDYRPLTIIGLGRERERPARKALKRMIVIDPRMTIEQVSHVVERCRARWQNEGHGEYVRIAEDAQLELGTLSPIVYINLKVSAYCD